MTETTEVQPQKTFVLKDSPPELIEATDVEPKGRTYDKTFSEQPGAVRIEDVVLGMKLASLAITDDEEGTLEKIGKSNPWHIEALTVITGSEEEAHKPLTEILASHFDLTLDTHIDISGITKAGHALDTQGYIAHNDEMIVLAYRCTTSGFDWITNMSTTTSAWEPEEDIDQGHSGHFSCLSGYCCVEGEYKPRVHTGFYNNFLVTAPLIQQYIDPLLGPDQPPRTLYVVGHSLGAGIASMAACYFLLEHDWTQLAQKLVVVTAGGPRPVQNSMKVKIEEEMAKLRPLDKAVMCRLVRDKDCVPNVPPAVFGFKHLPKLVYITEEGEVLINPKLSEKQKLSKEEMEELAAKNPDLASSFSGDKSVTDDEPKSKYEKKVSRVPRPFRDHMPDFYLKPLIELFQKETGTGPIPGTDKHDDGSEVDTEADSLHEEPVPTKRFSLKKLKSSKASKVSSPKASSKPKRKSSLFKRFSKSKKSTTEVTN